jgi:hypothetical protein
MGVGTLILIGSPTPGYVGISGGGISIVYRGIGPSEGPEASRMLFA